MAKEKLEKEVKKVKSIKGEKKKNKKKKGKNKSPKEGLLKGIQKELKLVIWPKAKEIIKYTIATIVLCLIFVAFFEVLNVIMAYVKGLFN